MPKYGFAIVFLNGACYWIRPYEANMFQNKITAKWIKLQATSRIRLGFLWEETVSEC